MTDKELDERECFEAAMLPYFDLRRDSDNSYTFMSAHAAWKAWQTRASLATPTGWKLVPVKPTPAMLEAAAKADDEGFEAGRSYGASGREIYDAMLAAAPAQEGAA